MMLSKKHLWIALCAYLLIFRQSQGHLRQPVLHNRSLLSIKVYVLVKKDLKTLVTSPQPLIQNQDFKELTLFDNF